MSLRDFRRLQSLCPSQEELYYREKRAYVPQPADEGILAVTERSEMRLSVRVVSYSPVLE